MLIATKSRIMGSLALPPVIKEAGWLATAVMALATVAFFLL